jgi:hypothetical protein
MIWTGAGVLGILLAAAAIPLVTSPDPLGAPVVLSPLTSSGGSGGAGSAGVAGIEGGGPQGGSSEPGSPVNNGLTPDDEPEVDENVVDGEVNPARKARQELLARPDMVMIRNADSRWRSLVRTIADKPHDPAADHTMKRIEELRADISAYRRDPNAGDVEELMARQKHILGELKQSTYWGPELAATESQLDQAFQIYKTTPPTTP